MRALTSTAVPGVGRQGRINACKTSVHIFLVDPFVQVDFAQVLWNQLPREGLGDAQRILPESSKREKKKVERKQKRKAEKIDRGEVSLLTRAFMKCNLG